MLPTSRPCQRPYYQSIMNLEVSRNADRMGSPAEYKLKECMCLNVCVCVCMCVFRTVFFFSCARMRQGILGKTPDPESRTRNMRHYPVELSAPPFISIKTCNNARTLG